MSYPNPFTDDCFVDLLQQLDFVGNLSHGSYRILQDICSLGQQLSYDSQTQKKYGEPMLWIGIYIAVASLLCVLAMVVDLLHGFLNKKLWFPCKYFTINAASLMVITVAMKLPVDLNNPMPGYADQVAKKGSMAFMCIMMVNLMPSLATMNNKELLSNFIALAILIITVAVNVCIEIKTGVVDTYYYGTVNPIIYVVVMLVLLVILMSSTLAIPTSKWIFESKYQELHKMASNEQESQLHAGMSTVEKMRKYVGRYWVMAGTGSPQFVMATSPTSAASGVICVSMAILHSINIIEIVDPYFLEYQSDYKWSTAVILVIQAIGVIVGSIAPLFRCFAALSFKLSLKWGLNHIKVFRVQSYWTQKLSDWKCQQSHLPLPIGSRKFKLLTHHLKNQILSCCTGCQKAIVVACKTIGLIPIFFVIFAFYCFHGFKSLKAMFFRESISSISGTTPECEQNRTTEDLSRYVLQLNEEVEFAEKSLKRITNSLNRLIKKAEKQKPNNLLKLLEQPLGFEGVELFDRNNVLLLLSEEPLNCWSLKVITLTSIAIAISNIRKNLVDTLLSSVDEGLKYAYLVEESLNATNPSVKFQKAAKKLWLEVEAHHKWLDNNLQGDACKGQSSEETLKWLMDKAEEIIAELERNKDGPTQTSLDISIPAHSMYNITKRILLSYQGINGQLIREEPLFGQLSAMIADVFAACFINLPRVIETKLYASAIEKREESVKAAAQLFGETKEIINKLQERELLGLNPDQNNIC